MSACLPERRRITHSPYVSLSGKSRGDRLRNSEVFGPIAGIESQGPTITGETFLRYDFRARGIHSSW